MPEIKPRIDDDSVGLCDYDTTCPQRTWTRELCDSGYEYNECKVLGYLVPNEHVCPVWAKHMAVECEAWRSGVLTQVRHGYSNDGQVLVKYRNNLTHAIFSTITEAVDALMDERE